MYYVCNLKIMIWKKIEERVVLIYDIVTTKKFSSYPKLDVRRRRYTTLVDDNDGVWSGNRGDVDVRLKNITHLTN